MKQPVRKATVQPDYLQQAFTVDVNKKYNCQCDIICNTEDTGIFKC